MLARCSPVCTNMRFASTTMFVLVGWLAFSAITLTIGVPTTTATTATNVSVLQARLKAAEAALKRTEAQGREGSKKEVEELRRAFSELLKEKKALTKVVRDERKQLVELQARIKNPTLGEWLRKRASHAGGLLDLPEAEALGYYARLYMQPKLGKARDRLVALEQHVEAGVDHLLPARYGALVAILLTAALVGFPALLVFRVAISLSRTLSIAQYVLLVNVFLTALTTGLLGTRLLLGQDPLQTMYEGAEHLFMATQLVLSLLYIGFLLLLGAAIYQGRKRGIFVCELVFYIMIGLNYRRRVWQPVMVGEVIHSNAMMYVVYLVDFICMTVLTVCASNRPGQNDAFLPTSKRSMKRS